jgi:hypothetical protein
MLQFTDLLALELLVQIMKSVKITAYERLCSKAIINIFTATRKLCHIYFPVFVMYDCPVDVG